MATTKALLDAFAKASSTMAYVQKGTTKVEVASFVPPTSWSDAVSYTCPSDGVIIGETTSSSGIACFSSSSGRFYVVQAGSTQALKFHSWSCPVSKGDTVRICVFFSDATDTDARKVYFVPCRGQK